MTDDSRPPGLLPRVDDPYGGEPDPELDKCDLCRRKNHLHSVGEAPGQGAFGPQLWLCIGCITAPAQTCVACSEQWRVPCTQPAQSGVLCHRCDCDLQDHYDNQRYEEQP